MSNSFDFERKLMDRLENMKKHATGNGSTQCVLCADGFGMLGASSVTCIDCHKVKKEELKINLIEFLDFFFKSVCNKCSIETMFNQQMISLCKICSENREVIHKNFQSILFIYFLSLENKSYGKNLAPGSSELYLNVRMFRLKSNLRLQLIRRRQFKVKISSIPMSFFFLIDKTFFQLSDHSLSNDEDSNSDDPQIHSERFHSRGSAFIRKKISSLFFNCFLKFFLLVDKNSLENVSHHSSSGNSYQQIFEQKQSINDQDRDTSFDSFKTDGHSSKGSFENLLKTLRKFICLYFRTFNG